MARAVLQRLLDDDVVHEHLTEAVSHMRAAVVRVAGAEKPRETHRLRTFVLALAVGAAAAAAVASKSRGAGA